jgi:hypothetical protein
MQSLLTEGGFLCELGALQASTVRLEEALILAQRLDSKAGRAEALLWLGVVAPAQQQPEDSVRLMREAAQLSQELGWARGEALARAQLALVLAADGALRAAAAEGARAVELAARDAPASAAALAALAQVAIRNDPAAALRHSEQAMGLWRVHAFTERVSLVRLAYVESLLACERVDDARRELRDAVGWVQARADSIEDASLRASFLTVPPENRRLLGLADTWLS